MRRLSRLLSRTSIGSNSPATQAPVPQKIPLLELPTEILLLIQRHLLHEHALCLSLTCKQAYNLFFHRTTGDDSHRFRAHHFLRLLERDYPDLIACSRHEILYAWPKRSGKRFQCPRCIKVERALVVCDKACRVGFYGIFDAERRLMIRHAFLSPQHGISLRLLNHVCKRSKAKIPNEVRAKAVGKSLMIWRIHHYETRIDFESWKDLGIDKNFNEAICVQYSRYIRTLVIMAIHHARQRRQWLIKASSPEKSYVDRLTSWYTPIIFKCPHCATDIRVRMDQISSTSIVVRLDVFQDLGGLAEMTTAQEQVLEMRSNPYSYPLTIPEKINRLNENLENRYFGDSERAEKSCEGIRWNSAFITQWYHNLHLEARPYVRYRDPTTPMPVYLSYRKLRFRQERRTDGHGQQ